MNDVDHEINYCNALTRHDVRSEDSVQRTGGTIQPYTTLPHRESLGVTRLKPQAN